MRIRDNRSSFLCAVRTIFLAPIRAKPMVTRDSMTFPRSSSEMKFRPFSRRAYFILQMAFWLLITGLGFNSTLLVGLPSNIVHEFDPTTRDIILEKLVMLRPRRWLGAITLPLIGLLLSHVLHLASTRWSWSERPLRQLVPIAILSCLVLSVIGFLADNAIAIVANHWQKEDVIFCDGFLYYLGEGSVPGFFVLGAWIVIYYACVAFDRIRKMEFMQLAQDAAMKDARLDAITTQLNPHFLFNSLNTVRGLIENSPERARDAVTHLAHVLRASLDQAQQRLIPFPQELETVHAHLMLESARHGSRLAITAEIDPGVSTAVIPPLLLQTLVENAVKHGVAKNPGPGFVYYEARMKSDVLELVVRNSGTLASQWDRSGNGLGLIHVRERLALLFRNATSLSISDDDGMVTVKACIPQNQPEARAR